MGSTTRHAAKQGELSVTMLCVEPVDFYDAMKIAQSYGRRLLNTSDFGRLGQEGITTLKEALGRRNRLWLGDEREITQPEKAKLERAVTEVFGATCRVFATKAPFILTGNFNDVTDGKMTISDDASKTSEPNHRTRTRLSVIALVELANPRV